MFKSAKIDLPVFPQHRKVSFDKMQEISYYKEYYMQKAAKTSARLAFME